MTKRIMPIKKRSKEKVIKEIDRVFLTRFREKMDVAAEKIGKELGIIIDFGKITFTDVDFRGSFNARLNGIKTREETLYEQNQAFLGLLPLGSKIKINGKFYIIVGYNPRARVKPIILKGDGNEKIYLSKIVPEMKAKIIKRRKKA